MPFEADKLTHRHAELPDLFGAAPFCHRRASPRFYTAKTHSDISRPLIAALRKVYSRSMLGVPGRLRSLAEQERGRTTPLGDMRIRQKRPSISQRGRIKSGCRQTGSKSSACPNYAERFAENEIDVSVLRHQEQSGP
jgi:hypothetical protein